MEKIKTKDGNIRKGTISGRRNHKCPVASLEDERKGKIEVAAAERIARVIEFGERRYGSFPHERTDWMSTLSGSFPYSPKGLNRGRLKRRVLNSGLKPPPRTKGRKKDERKISNQKTLGRRDRDREKQGEKRLGKKNPKKDRSRLTEGLRRPGAQSTSQGGEDLASKRKKRNLINRG